MQRIIDKDYKVEERMRLACEVDGIKLPNALNDIVVSNSKGGSFMRYSLSVDDGVIVSTPTGSTAYSLAAGGPIVVENAKTMSIVPICSMNKNNPLIVNDNSKVVISDISSNVGCDLIIDGQKRLRLRNNNVRVRKVKTPALFVRLSDEYLRIFGKMREKTEHVILSKDAPPSAKFIFKVLSYNGALNQQEIIGETQLPARTVRNALEYLVKSGIIQKRTTLRDTRQAVYSIVE